MKKTRLRPISEKRMKLLKQELLIRKQLCARAKGTFVTACWHEGEAYMGFCVGGFCEECGKQASYPAGMLVPHHSGIGAKRKPLSLNDKIVCRVCHNKKHHIREAKQ